LRAQRSRARRRDHRSICPGPHRAEGLAAMPRVIGSDAGPLTLALCGLHAGRVFPALTLPTADALAEPSPLVRALLDAHAVAPLDLVVGPSGYGLPISSARDLGEADLELAFLPGEHDPGTIE